ncbi:hypothetical protein [Bradyrhizobium cenepequi]|uniref:hypothetical protein n=1 Tax=Bradyrhizobium cenepequi TaxID=2821403 RepID=UPI001CE39FFE|nr:hypothetical protein [Bradyrhizobium cenepequi]MCA6109650.1 hypothetical protein [Bradyrhizobium cenepequi]
MNRNSTVAERAQTFPDFELRVAVAQGTSNANMHSGLVTDLIGNRKLAETDAYLCGPGAMTERARATAAEGGADPSAIFAERFLSSASNLATGVSSNLELIGEKID